MKALEFSRVAVVEFFPILNIIPWTSWKKSTSHVRTLSDNFYGRLYTTVQNRLKRNEGNGAFMEEAIIHSSDWGLKTEEVVKSVSSHLLSGYTHPIPP
jgi:hypothetical protein